MIFFAENLKGIVVALEALIKADLDRIDIGLDTPFISGPIFLRDSHGQNFGTLRDDDGEWYWEPPVDDEDE